MVAISVDRPSAWVHLQNALEKGLLPDDATLVQLVQDRNSVVYGQPVEGLAWPEDPLRSVIISAPAANGQLPGSTHCMSCPIPVIEFGVDGPLEFRKVSYVMLR